ncbi:MAG: SAM-dependent methyltransferase [Deltaproteobacteria bacterium]|nr:SAM-dependent methyltransferase [Deltaproteobacteria bacterium]
MRDEHASFTAGYVAACRGLGAALPAEARLVDDPYAARFLGSVAGRAVVGLRGARGLSAELASFLPLVLYMQVRTRVLDEAVERFAAGGGRQVVLLGAGFDARAARFPELRFFEVDHPATQRHKRDVLGSDAPPSSNYVAFHFERDPMNDLPAKLAEHGHDRTAPTLTIWEGVTMYLTEPAIEASLAAVREYSRGSSASRLAMTYFDRTRIDFPMTPFRRLSRLAVAAVGEPFRWGWDPDALPGWLASRGFHVEEDFDVADHARRLLPHRYARRVGRGASHIAIISMLG